MVRPIILICLTMATALLPYLSLFSQDTKRNTWPEFRGTNRSGIAQPEQDPPVDLNSDDCLIWKTPLLSGMSSPCIWGDRIFLTGFDKENQKLHTLCYNRLNGELIWDRIVPAKEIEPYHATGNPADATPATDGEYVYFYFGSYGLLCYDFAGEVLWTHELPVNDNIYGSGVSPILAENLVIIPIRRPVEGHFLLALDSKSGQQVWKRPVKYIGWSTPVLCENDLIYHGIHTIAGYDINDGSEKWHVSFRTTGTSSPTVCNDIIYVATYTVLGEQNRRLQMPDYTELLNEHDSDGDAILSKEEFPADLQYNRYPETPDIPDAVLFLKDYWGWVDRDKSNSVDSTEWKSFLDLYALRSKDHGLVAIKSGGTGDVTADHVLWKENEGIPEVPSPLFYKDRIYMIKNGGKVTCINALTGQPLYNERLGTAGPYFSSPVVASDRIYIASLNGTVVVFEAGDKLKVLARNKLGEKIAATPAIVDDKLYIRTTKHLYAFGK